MKRLLLVDTCGTVASIALAEVQAAGSAAVAAAQELPGRSASERLVPVVREMLGSQGWRLGDLSAIVVARGPGSFTGVRVGLAAAKGWSEAAGVPLIAVSRLEVLAFSAKVSPVWAVLDAGRGEVYAGEYREARLLREILLTSEHLCETAGGSAVVVCEPKLAHSLRGLSTLLVEEPGAAALLPIAAERLERGEFEDAALLDANYLRRMEQEITARLESRLAAGPER